MNSAIPSVTRNEVMPIFATSSPFPSPMSTATPSGDEQGELRCQLRVVHEHVHHQGREAEDGAHGEVEDPGREQQRHPQGDDAELGDEREHVADVRERHELRLDERQHDPGTDQQADGDE